jgi:hypothetical protein
MSDVGIAPDCSEVLRRAGRLARSRGEGAISATHLLLAVMAQANSPWPLLVVERGGLNFRNAIRRLDWKGGDELEEIAGSETLVYRAAMRLMAIVFVVSARRMILRLRRIAVAPSPAPTWDLNAAEALALARRLAREGEKSQAPATVGVGHVLLSLASSPGSHLRLIDGGTVIACAVRRELGLDAWHHRLVLKCDWIKLKMRRLGMKLDREVSTHGRLSAWGLAWAADGLVGLLVAIAIFPITVLANVLLYLFLWPAALLMAGLRSACGIALGYRTTNHRWHEIPGGEVGLAGLGTRISDRRVAVLVVVPRLLAFAFSVAALVVIIWRGQRLGVFSFPTLFARPDIASGGAAESFWLMPSVLLSDMLEQDGVPAGIGLLAGAGLGFMSVPTYRELTLIRLYAGHDVGQGSRLVRFATLPASILTGAIACLEAILPFRNGPIYLTVYLVPMILSLLLAAVISALLPY